ncbi:MAG: ammonium transporter [Gammaproteobacteria bacterium]|jgi:Amt family ammonium transporter
MTEMEFALNTFYLVLSGAFVMWMAAGFTMLEAGLVRSKNVSEIVTKNLGLYSIACVMYLACGFYLMYPGDDVINAYLPGMGTTWGISLAGLTANYDLGYSDAADFFFQVVFVATAMSIVSGAVAERMKLVPFFIFAVVMTGFIYPVQGYWKWGGGWLDAIGYTDFAGSGVVHLCGASAALAAVLILGARAGKYGSDGSVTVMRGSNIPIAALGAFILWLGWFGFNGGSQLAVHTVDNANAVAQVFLNTNAAAAGGVLGAIIISKILTGKMDVTMGINGAIAGLVAITAAPDTPSGGLATIIGLIGGVIVYFSVVFFDSVLKVDDPVGAISAHGTVGVWGIMATPLSGAGAFGTQAIGAVSIFLWTFITAGATLLVIKAIMGLRPTMEDEMEGMDASEVGVSAYPEFSE